MSLARLPSLGLGSVALAAVLLTACGARRRDVPDAPEWTTEKGRLETKVVLIEAMLDANAVQEALLEIASMRAKGEQAKELDYLQGRGLLIQGVTSEAERLLLAATADMKNDARPWRTLGVLYADLQRTDEAIAAFQRAAEYDPNDAAIWNNLGFLLMSVKRHDESSEALQKAVALDATNPRYRNNLGFALANKGKYDDALRAFRSTGSNADAHANVALAYELAGDPEQADMHYHKALELSPSHVAATEGLARLETPPELAP